MSVIIVAVSAVCIALIAAIIAVRHAIKTAAEQKRNPTTDEFGIIRKVYSQPYAYDNVDSLSMHAETQYFVDFEPEIGSMKTLRFDKNLLPAIMQGEYGRILYKGGKVINFIRHSYPNDAYNSNNFNIPPGSSECSDRTTEDDPIRFYGEVEKLDLNVMSTDPLYCNNSDINSFVDNLLESKAVGFFCLGNAQGRIIEFSNENNPTIFEIRIPTNENAYEAQIHSSLIKILINSFLNGENVINQYSFRLSNLY